MTNLEITPEEEKALIQQFFDHSRDLLGDYFTERNLTLSNSQLFAFVYW